MDFDVSFGAAVQEFWRARAAQAAKQLDSGRADTGTRGAVTGGGHMNTFANLCADVLIGAGVEEVCVKRHSQLEVPGYYRSEKKWDLLVVKNEQLHVAIEFKSQVGSFGNNVNNRAEESVGTAEDLWTAYREGLLGSGPQPFIGFFYLLQDAPAVHRSIKNAQPHFEVDPLFKGATYAKRIEILCKRLVFERKFTSACLTLTQEGDPATWRHPAEELSWFRFSAALKGAAVTIANL